MYGLHLLCGEGLPLHLAFRTFGEKEKGMHHLVMVFLLVTDVASSQKQDSAV